MTVARWKKCVDGVEGKEPWQLTHWKNKCFTFSRCAEHGKRTIDYFLPCFANGTLRCKRKAMYYFSVNPAIYSLLVVDLLTKTVPVCFSNHKTKAWAWTTLGHLIKNIGNSIANWFYLCSGCSIFYSAFVVALMWNHGMARIARE